MIKKCPVLFIIFVLFAHGLSYAQSPQDGYGKMTLADGSVYEGQLKDGIFEGKGKIDYADQRQYVGEFKDGLYDGKGILYYADGSKYEGEFKEGFLNGHGVMTYADGTELKGKFDRGDFVSIVTEDAKDTKSDNVANNQSKRL